mmetsp:Transcript_16404/g.40520  ORF Transcript_16404/g.40520 Transcript_16404/m.40520 type:complete len:200 (+) Transcript_16404:1030-1629(+)
MKRGRPRVEDGSDCARPEGQRSEREPDFGEQRAVVAAEMYRNVVSGKLWREQKAAGQEESRAKRPAEPLVTWEAEERCCPQHHDVRQNDGPFAACGRVHVQPDPVQLHREMEPSPQTRGANRPGKHSVPRPRPPRTKNARFDTFRDGGLGLLGQNAPAARVRGFKTVQHLSHFFARDLLVAFLTHLLPLLRHDAAAPIC